MKNKMNVVDKKKTTKSDNEIQIKKDRKENIWHLTALNVN